MPKMLLNAPLSVLKGGDLAHGKAAKHTRTAM